MILDFNDIEVRVFSAREARTWSHQWATSIVSLVDKQTDAVARPSHIPSDRHLVLEFNDVTSVHFGTPPSLGHISTLVNFARELPQGERCLIHCRGGIGRSTAGAICLLVARGHSMESSISRVEEIRPILQPNGLMMFLLDQVLNANGELFFSFHTWAFRQTWWPPDGFAPSRSLSSTEIETGLQKITHRRRPK